MVQTYTYDKNKTEHPIGCGARSSPCKDILGMVCSLFEQIEAKFLRLASHHVKCLFKIIRNSPECDF